MRHALRARSRPNVSLPVLPVLSPQRGGAIPLHSRVAKWRTASLILVYVLITAHVLHWWITGRSLGRFVMSDSMQGLEFGEITPGFILFGIAALITAVFGRFMCGWFCHMAGLQDLSAWALRKVGLRPHVFRSRLLGYVPLGLALYMFVWPTLKREAVSPLLANMWPAAATWLGPPREFPGFTFLWTTEHMWDGLPNIWIGIPFLIVCGLATVWFLGARGLCRYVCPYGGLLLPAEQLAPMRVTVDPKACDQCGKCTAACTAGVRVHDQVREFGAILDRNCVRSLDCVSVCPQSALSLKFGKPGALVHGKVARLPAMGYDLGWREELAVAGMFLGTFVVLRGLYGLLPMLLAAASAVLVGYVLWKSLALVRQQNVRLGGARLKLHGRLTWLGKVFGTAGIAFAVLLMHSAAIKLIIMAGSRADDRVMVPYDIALRGEGVPASDVTAAREAMAWFARAQGIAHGGWGLIDTPEVSVRMSWLKLVVGDRTGAEEELRRLVRSGRGSDGTGVSLGRLLLALGRPDDAVRELTDAWKANPEWTGTRDLLCAVWAGTGRFDTAEQAYRDRLKLRDFDGVARIGLARLYMSAGRGDDALREGARAANDSPQEPGVRADYSLILASTGRINEAVAELRSAGDSRPAARQRLNALAADILRRAGREADATQLELSAKARG
jgi:polyferredoxin/tetratricopeptide (TPR) repeat protein